MKKVKSKDGDSGDDGLTFSGLSFKILFWSVQKKLKHSYNYKKWEKLVMDNLGGETADVYKLQDRQGYPDHIMIKNNNIMCWDNFKTFCKEVNFCQIEDFKLTKYSSMFVECKQRHLPINSKIGNKLVDSDTGLEVLPDIVERVYTEIQTRQPVQTENIHILAKQNKPTLYAFNIYNKKYKVNIFAFILLSKCDDKLGVIDCLYKHGSSKFKKLQ